MKHLAQIHIDFLKIARKWDDLSIEEQKGYLQRHPGSRRRLTAQPAQSVVPTVEKIEQTVPVTPEPVKTRPPKSMDKKEISKLLNDTHLFADKIGYSEKKGGFVFKRGYFYRNGMDSSKFADAIKAKTQKLGLTPVLVDSSDNWHAWPKDSWFEAVIKFEQMKATSLVKC